MMMCIARMLVAAAVVDAAPACAHNSLAAPPAPHVLAKPRLGSVSEASLAALL
jgi:hypothetical protein